MESREPASSRPHSRLKRSNPSKTPTNSRKRSSKRTNLNKQLELLQNILTSPKSTIVLLMLTVLIYYATLSEDDIDIVALQADLRTLIHDQNDAIVVINNTIAQFYVHQTPNQFFLALMGPSGVGKTHIANIVKRHFHSSIFELQAPLARKERNNYLSKIRSSWANFNLVLIDDLRLTDLDDLLEIVRDIPNDLNVLFIFIFNIQETDNNLIKTVHYEHVDKVQQRFMEAKIGLRIAVFHEFSSKQVSNWIAKQLSGKGIEPEFYAEITQAIFEEQDIKNYGLKGLDSKINLRL